MNRLSRSWLRFSALAAVAGCGNVVWNPTVATIPYDGPPDRDPGPPTDQGARCPDYNPLKNLYWGDLHTHTSYSFDAYVAGTRADPRDAYRFARGTPVDVASGAKTKGPRTQIDRPLDFLAVTDHSEYLNVISECVLGDPSGHYDAPFCKAFRDQGSSAQKAALADTLVQLARIHPAGPLLCLGSEARVEACMNGERSAWKRMQEATAAAYDRCRFTSLNAFEWTAQTATNNTHRNVIYAGDKVSSLPIDYIRFPDALSLWRELSRSCRSDEGCDAITIPHNSNASHGAMWASASEDAALPYMQRYQTLVEIFQHKGNSECYPGDKLSDPNCDFEILKGGFLNAVFGIPDLGGSGASGYVRSGLAQGLVAYGKKGKNPLKMGIIGSTDTHDATPGNVKESTWPGHMGAKDDTPAKRLDSGSSALNPGGITGVWAEQNTREGIFASLKRREVYGTSGPRIALRFYVVPGLDGDSAAQALCDDPSFPTRLLAAGGLPMGATLRDGHKPYVFVFAMKDEASLSQVEILKLWSDPKDEPHAEVHAIPLAGAAQARACVFFGDPAFDPRRPSLYYARVLEEPTWRWTHYDCATDPKANPKGCDPNNAQGLDVKIQERAWSSPVFFEP
jgi:hypothetical protein